MKLPLMELPVILWEPLSQPVMIHLSIHLSICLCFLLGTAASDGATEMEYLVIQLSVREMTRLCTLLLSHVNYLMLIDLYSRCNRFCRRRRQIYLDLLDNVSSPWPSSFSRCSFFLVACFLPISLRLILRLCPSPPFYWPTMTLGHCSRNASIYCAHKKTIT